MTPFLHSAIRESRTGRAAPLASFGLLLVPLLSPAFAASQTAPPSSASQRQSVKPSSAPKDVDELQSRLQAASGAREVGNPDSVARANRLVLALALRKLGYVRIAQTAFPQAGELYKRSLELEEAGIARGLGNSRSIRKPPG